MKKPRISKAHFVFLVVLLSPIGVQAATVGAVRLEHSASGEAGVAFERGLAQLHNFEYADAFAESLTRTPNRRLSLEGLDRANAAMTGN